MMMIDHHEGAIDLSMARGSGVEATLDSLAHYTIEEQRREQDELSDSLQVWYGS